MKFKIYNRLFFILFCGLFFKLAYADVKIGVVDIQWLIDNSPYSSKATQILQQEFKTKEEQINSDIKLLREMQDDFKNNQNNLSDVQLKTRERRILTLERDIKRAESDFKELLNLRKNEEMLKVQQIIVQSIEQVGKRDEFDVIFYDSIAYFNKQINISENVLDLVKEKFQNEQKTQ